MKKLFFVLLATFAVMGSTSSTTADDTAPVYYSLQVSSVSSAAIVILGSGNVVIGTGQGTFEGYFVPGTAYKIKVYAVGHEEVTLPKTGFYELTENTSWTINLVHME